MYEAPSIREVGTVAGLTLEGQFALDYDGHLFRGDKEDGGLS
ncbi:MULTISPECIES: lasso RiPP family leader peptide-containing protein [Isoptericola]|uniref:Lasso RiPP family leader peptide-containing protein n=1 Tax=Isoptericola haloaureus TaxID=1542902 RepID=A0ABU7Z4V7_9MICO|nr:lasso RiPP family leader peptide-containing protein [Isoptericola sp. AK164]